MFKQKCPMCDFTMTDRDDWNIVFNWCVDCTEKEVKKNKSIMLLNGDKDDTNPAIATTGFVKRRMHGSITT
jgi:hypothetical protein